MKTLKPEVSDAERAVHHHKRRQLVRAMAAIIDIARRKPCFSPADLAPDIVPEADRQGVASNCWNSLVALEIIEKLPKIFNDASLGIWAGRTCNTNDGAKKRWTHAYRLLSLAKAEAWLSRNADALPPRPACSSRPMVQINLLEAT